MGKMRLIAVKNMWLGLNWCPAGWVYETSSFAIVLNCCNTFFYCVSISRIHYYSAYRNRAWARGMYRPEIVAPSTAHPALDKAAALFGMTIRRVPVREDDRVHAAAVKRAIGPHTCMVQLQLYSISDQTTPGLCGLKGNFFLLDCRFGSKSHHRNCGSNWEALRGCYWYHLLPALFLLNSKKQDFQGRTAVWRSSACRLHSRWLSTSIYGILRLLDPHFRLPPAWGYIHSHRFASCRCNCSKTPNQVSKNTFCSMGRPRDRVLFSCTVISRWCVISVSVTVTGLVAFMQHQHWLEVVMEVLWQLHGQRFWARLSLYIPFQQYLHLWYFGSSIFLLFIY